MTARAEPYAVVADDYDPDCWETIAEVLVEAIGTHPATAKQQARKSQGILAEKLDAARAECLCRACIAKGVTAHSVPQDSLPVLPRPVRLHELWITPGALWVRRGPAGPRESLPWDSILLIAVTDTVKTENFHRWYTVRSGSDYEETEVKVVKQTQHFPELLVDLYASSPQGPPARFRVMSREVNYREALGADAPDALIDANSRLDGFRLLVSRIGSHATGACIPPETVVLLGGAAEPGCRLRNLRDLDDFDAYNRWLLQKRARDLGSGSPAASRAVPAGDGPTQLPNPQISLD